MKNSKLLPGINCLALLSVVFLLSCVDEAKYSININKGALIVNEGTFGKSNSSVSYYSYNENKVVNDIFSEVNGRSLGDVLQSIYIDSIYAYLIVNSSNKIEVVSRYSFSEVGVIEGVNSPRYMTICDRKGYVSCWGDSSLKVVDLHTFNITNSIKVGAGPEKMLTYRNKLFVANGGMYSTDSTISVIDLTNETVYKTIVVGYNPKDLEIDRNDDLWVICYGKEVYDDNYKLVDSSASELVRVSSTTYEVLQRITISDSKHASILDINQDRSILYFGGGFSFGWIYKLPISQTDNPAEKFCEDYSYGFSVNPANDEIFVMIAPSFTDAGTLNRYDADGNLLGTYETGIGPSSAAFVNNLY
jgi:hypothetical protein